MLTAAGARVHALLYLLDPVESQFENMADIATVAGCTRATISKSLLDFTDSIDLKVSHGKGAHTRASCARAQRAAFARGRHASQIKAAKKAAAAAEAKPEAVIDPALAETVLIS